MTSDYRSSNLQRRSFRGQNLSGADFSRTDLSGVDFTTAILDGANFSHADLRGAVFRQSSLIGANLQFSRSGIASDRDLIFRSTLLIIAVLLGLLAGFTASSIVELLINESKVLDIYHDVKFVMPWQTVSGLLSIGNGSIYIITSLWKNLTIAIWVSSFSGVMLGTIVGLIVVDAGVRSSQPWKLGGELTMAIVGPSTMSMFQTILITVFLAIIAIVLRSNLQILIAVAVGITLMVISASNAHASLHLLVGSTLLSIAIIAVGITVGDRAMLEDSRYKSIREMSIYIATYFGTCFDRANLTDANLEYALLANTNLTAANLTRTNLHGVLQLNSARLDRTILIDSLVRNLLVTHALNHRNYLGCNLQGAYLAGADLTNTDFTGANLSEANLSGSQLAGANLTRILAVGTNFQFANLTGACIADWSIDRTTNLTDIDCDYVYLKSSNLDRCPASGSFAIGDFAQLFQEIRNTIDLIFHHGIDWTSFSNAWQQIQIENDGTPLSICSIEHKGTGTIVVKVEVPLKLDKAQLHQDFDRSYQLLLQTVEDRYQAELSGRDAQIERLHQRELAIYREQQNNLQTILQSLINPSMSTANSEQLVTLKLGTRDANRNLAVTVEISVRGLTPRAAAVGKLDNESDIIAAYQDWKNIYRQYLDSSRLDIPENQSTNLKQPNLQIIQHNDYINECQIAAQILKQKLNQWLDLADFKPIKELILQELQPSQSIQISIQTDELPIRQLPFQLWDLFDRFTQAETTIASSTYRSITKQRPKHQQLEILAIFGDSQGIDLDIDRESLSQLPNARVEFLVEPTRQILNDLLWSKHWDIIFFAGHSASDPSLTTGHLKINANDRLTITELKYALKQSIENGLKLVIINSCDSLGLATELISIQLPQAIVMREPVPDFVAQQFLKYFLIAFASGLPLDRSVRQAREQLQGLEDRYPCASWLPMICQNPAEIINY
jgi:uncharacterized protein YjbI with pentapeptide repeats